VALVLRSHLALLSAFRRRVRYPAADHARRDAIQWHQCSECRPAIEPFGLPMLPWHRKREANPSVRTPSTSSDHLTLELCLNSACHAVISPLIGLVSYRAPFLERGWYVPAAFVLFAERPVRGIAVHRTLSRGRNGHRRQSQSSPGQQRPPPRAFRFRQATTGARWHPPSWSRPAGECRQALQTQSHAPDRRAALHDVVNVAGTGARTDSLASLRIGLAWSPPPYR